MKASSKKKVVILLLISATVLTISAGTAEKKEASEKPTSNAKFITFCITKGGPLVAAGAITVFIVSRLNEIEKKIDKTIADTAKNSTDIVQLEQKKIGHNNGNNTPLLTDIHLGNHRHSPSARDERSITTESSKKSKKDFPRSSQLLQETTTQSHTASVIGQSDSDDDSHTQQSHQKK